MDWKLFSMFNWHTQFNLTTTHTNEQEWVDERSTYRRTIQTVARVRRERTRHEISLQLLHADGTSHRWDLE
ncbi:MAG: hypothetical protein V8R91_20285 [Butyricimonas faecihominis]